MTNYDIGTHKSLQGRHKLISANRTIEGMHVAAEIVNSLRNSQEEVPNEAELRAFIGRIALPPDVVLQEDSKHDDFVHLRRALRLLWENTDFERIEFVNRTLSTYRLTAHLETGAREARPSVILVTTIPGAVPQLASIAFTSVVAVISNGDTSRMKLCSAVDCDGVFFDASKNQSRMFCRLSCANRTHAAASRAAKKASFGSQASE